MENISKTYCIGVICSKENAMKKIALLVTILCAGQLYSMEFEKSELNPTIWRQEQLPDDVKTLIMVAFAESGDNLKQAINNVKKVSLINTDLNKMINLNDIKGFTKIVHMLVNKSPDIPLDEHPFMGQEAWMKLRKTWPYPAMPFDVDPIHNEYIYDKIIGSTPGLVAYLFRTPIATKYIDLGNKLIEAVMNKNIDSVIYLIKEGADPNYFKISSPLNFAITSRYPEMVELLLNAGANAGAISESSYYDYDYRLHHTQEQQENKEKIRKMIDNAKKK